MDLKGLRYVVAVADAASFTKAAKNLFVAQPALSRKVAQVEREFGAAFFVRTGQQLQLTEAGKVFYRGARQILTDCQRLEQDMDQILRRAESLRLVYVTDCEVSYVTDMVRAMREKYPSVEISAQSYTALPEDHNTLSQTLELLRQKRLDTMLVIQPEWEGEDMGWLEHRCVEPGGLCAFVPPGHPLWGKDTVRASDLWEYTLVLPPNTSTPNLVRAMRRALGEPPHVVFFHNTKDFRVKVITENCVGIMPASSRSFESHFLHCIDISDVPGGFDLELVWAKDNKKPALKKLLSIL